MPLPHDTAHPDDEELEQYVLGLLPDNDTERLDEASIVDDEVAARLRVVESDLIDSYLRGQLAGDKLQRFESYYLSSPRRREAVRLAASFVRAVDQPFPGAKAVRSGAHLARPRRIAGMMAAAALVVVVSGFFLYEFGRPGNELTRVTPERRMPAVEKGLAASEPLDDGRAAPEPALVTVVLLPPMRTVAPIPAIAIPAGANRVGFELRLESDDFPEYRVELKDLATSRILWRSEWKAASASADQAAVSVVVPANLFGTRHYSFDLAGRATGGRAEMIGSYPVRTTKS